jgi:predicted RNA polymerase sigma factor
MGIDAVRCEALFASTAPSGDQLAASQLRHLVLRTLSDLGRDGCASRVAKAFATDPGSAAQRMSWARAQVYQHTL